VSGHQLPFRLSSNKKSSNTKINYFEAGKAKKAQESPTPFGRGIKTEKCSFLIAQKAVILSRT
jgi:hypothetical protein